MASDPRCPVHECRSRIGAIAVQRQGVPLPDEASRMPDVSVSRCRYLGHSRLHHAREGP
jgi:hypothetical protein